MWMSMLLPLFRPWLSEFYTALNHNPVIVLQCSVRQLAEITGNLRPDLRLVSDCALSRAKAGWRLREVAHKPIETIADARCATVGGLGRAWVRLEDPASQVAQVDKELRLSARIWKTALTTSALAVPFADEADDVTQAAADACANESWAGLGGCFDMGEGVEAAKVAWFQIQVKPDEFPPAWKLRKSPQKDISFYELFAQVLLFSLRIKHRHRTQMVVNLRQDCDNMTSVCIGLRLFTTATPLRFAAQVLTAQALQNRASINIQHLPGRLNDLADKLSRQHGPAEIGVVIEKRVQVQVGDVLESYRNATQALQNMA